MHLLAQQRVGHRGERDKQQHPQHAHQPLPQHHGKQHPQGGQADGVAHDVRVDEVALDLLKHQKQRHKAQRLKRVRNQNQQRAHDAAHPRADNRDERRDGDKHADEQHIGHFEQRHRYKEHAAQNDRLQALARDKAGKGALGQAGHAQDLAGPFGL